MRITYYGHSCVSVHVDGHVLLFDPFITPNSLAKDIDISTIPATHILLTHGHEDHVADVEAIAARTEAPVIANYEVASWFAEKGVKNTMGMNTGGTVSLDSVKVKFVHAVHSSSMPDGAYGGTSGGFVVTGSEGSFHHAGDTALTLDMQLLKTYELRFAFLPIGDHFTMGVKDAVQAARLMEVKDVIGIHYDTFPPITIDHDNAKDAFAKQNIELHLPPIGGTLEI